MKWLVEGKRVIRGPPRGICYPRERKSRDSRGFARAARLGSPIMSISNTTNCTQPNEQCACTLCGCLSPPPVSVHAPVPVHAATNSSSSSSFAACICLLNSPASKIVLSFCSPTRRALRPALGSTSLPYNFQFPRGLTP